jgi:hypothetical protein
MSLTAFSTTARSATSSMGLSADEADGEPGVVAEPESVVVDGVEAHAANTRAAHVVAEAILTMLLMKVLLAEGVIPT